MHGPRGQRGFWEVNEWMVLAVLLAVLALAIAWFVYFIGAKGWIPGIAVLLADLAAIGGALAGGAWSERLVERPELRRFDDLPYRVVYWGGLLTVVAIAVWLPDAYDEYFAQHPIAGLLLTPLAAGALGAAVVSGIGLATFMILRSLLQEPAPTEAEAGTRTFEMHPAIAWLYWAGLLVAGAFALIGATLPWRTDDYSPSTVGLAIVGGTFFAGFVALGILVARRFPYCAIAADADGLWPAHLAKAQVLVPWQAIAAAKEHLLMQRLDLLGRNGELLLKIEYQLSGFKELRDLILRNMAAVELPALPLRRERGRGYHASELGVLAFFAVLGIYLGQENPWFGYLGMGLAVAYVGWEFLRAPCSIALDMRGVEIGYPLHERRFEYGDIASVEMTDDWEGGTRRPEVAVLLKGATEPLRLDGLGIEPPTLYAILVRERTRASEGR